MAENEQRAKAQRQGKLASWFDGLKGEFGKIIWPTKESLVKQTTAVVIVSIVLGLIIALMDSIIQYGVNFLVNL